MVLFSRDKNLTEDTESEAVIAHLLCFLLFSFLSDVFFFLPYCFCLSYKTNFLNTGLLYRLIGRKVLKAS